MLLISSLSSNISFSFSIRNSIFKPKDPIGRIHDTKYKNPFVFSLKVYYFPIPSFEVSKGPDFIIL